jgi:hypothetical protein
MYNHLEMKKYKEEEVKLESLITSALFWTEWSRSNALDLYSEVLGSNLDRVTAYPY